MGRLFTRVVVVSSLVLVGAVAPASAAARMYVSTSRADDGAASVSGYAYPEIAGVFQLDVVRGGSVVATAKQAGFVLVTPPSLQPGDQLVLTDVATTETHTATFTGQPTLDAPVCGASAFSGARDDGSTVTVTAAGPGADQGGPVQIYGAGTSFSGSFSTALPAAWTVKASQAREIDAGFTVFDAVSRVVGACPPPAPAAPEPADPPVVTPAPVAAPLVDAIAPVARLTTGSALFKAAAAYKALVGGTFADAVLVSEPATVTQTLYLDDGAKLPTATAAKVKAKAPTTLGSGKATAAKAGTVKVTVRLSKQGKSRLARGTTVNVALVTVVRDRAGNQRVLAPKRFRVKRP